MYYMYATTMTQKGQVTIPAPIRKKLGLKKGARVSFIEKNGEVMIGPEISAKDLIGSLKTNIKYDKRKARQAIGEYLAQRYVKTLSRH